MRTMRSYWEARSETFPCLCIFKKYPSLSLVPLKNDDRRVVKETRQVKMWRHQWQFRLVEGGFDQALILSYSTYFWSNCSDLA